MDNINGAQTIVIYAAAAFLLAGCVSTPRGLKADFISLPAGLPGIAGADEPKAYVSTSLAGDRLVIYCHEGEPRLKILLEKRTPMDLDAEVFLHTHENADVFLAQGTGQTLGADREITINPREFAKTLETTTEVIISAGAGGPTIDFPIGKSTLQVNRLECFL